MVNRDKIRKFIQVILDACRFQTLASCTSSTVLYNSHQAFLVKNRAPTAVALPISRFCRLAKARLGGFMTSTINRKRCHSGHVSNTSGCRCCPILLKHLREMWHAIRKPALQLASIGLTAQGLQDHICYRYAFTHGCSHLATQ